MYTVKRITNINVGNYHGVFTVTMKVSFRKVSGRILSG